MYDVIYIWDEIRVGRLKLPFARKLTFRCGNLCKLTIICSTAVRVTLESFVSFEAKEKDLDWEASGYKPRRAPC